jgi:succinate-acetate transporter protein
MAQYAAERRAEAAAPAVANPAPLGLSGFALTTFVLSCWNAGFFPAPNIVLGLALFYGGLAQLLAGMWEFRSGNTFGATAFSSYGGFWMAFAVFLIPAFNVFGAYPKAGDLHTALGVFLLGWTIFTAWMFLCSLRSNLATMAVFLLLAITFLVLAISELTGGTKSIAQLGGYLGILTALVAWYSAFAGVLASTKSAFTLPVWPRS